MRVLVTGTAGFIGAKLAERLLETDNEVIGIDNLNDYYDVRLKRWRLDRITKYLNFKFYKANIEDFDALKTIFKTHNFDAVINLAAQVGIRYSIKDPFSYISTNVRGTLNLLELCKLYKVHKFILASSSSLYAGQRAPFKENLLLNTPISPYAASKVAAESITYTYHYLYGIDITVLRYFTVYGPAGRPDMSPFRFIKCAIEGKSIEVFGDGTQKRDFTYIEDVIIGTIRALTPMGYEVINLGNNTPYSLNYMIKLIERYVGKNVNVIYKDFHKSDMKVTWADIMKAKKILKWEPKIKLEEGIKKTVEWFKKNKSWLKKLVY